MRHLVITLLMLLACASAALAEGRIEFAKTAIDFGTVKAKGGNVTMTYEFTNTGDEPVGIVTVTNGGCGCTKPKFPLEPIKPGQKGAITITFNPSTFRGEVNRSVKVKLSSQKKRVKLSFSGVVVPQ